MLDELADPVERQATLRAAAALRARRVARLRCDGWAATGLALALAFAERFRTELLLMRLAGARIDQELGELDRHEAELRRELSSLSASG